MIQDLKIINSIVESEKLDICVISPGGSCSNQLVDTLIKNNYNCKTPIWNKILCHCPEYIELNIPIIYIYDNPIKSFLSMKRRGKGFWDVNQRKLSNNRNTILSDENLLRLIIGQIKIWTNTNCKNVFVLHSKELFENAIVNKLKTFLKNDNLQHFPIMYTPPKTKIENINNHTYFTQLFNKYKSDIDSINNIYLQENMNDDSENNDDSTDNNHENI